MATLFVEYKDSGKKDASGKPIPEKQEEVINVATISRARVTASGLPVSITRLRPVSSPCCCAPVR